MNILCYEVKLMKSHSKSYEQYCCVKKRNVIFEEIAYHDGRKKLRCTMHPECVYCKNITLKIHLDEEKTDTD